MSNASEKLDFDSSQRAWWHLEEQRYDTRELDVASLLGTILDLWKKDQIPPLENPARARQDLIEIGFLTSYGKPTKEGIQWFDEFTRGMEQALSLVRLMKMGHVEMFWDGDSMKYCLTDVGYRFAKNRKQENA